MVFGVRYILLYTIQNKFHTYANNQEHSTEFELNEYAISIQQCQ